MDITKHNFSDEEIIEVEEYNDDTPPKVGLWIECYDDPARLMQLEKDDVIALAKHFNLIAD